MARLHPEEHLSFTRNRVTLNISWLCEIYPPMAVTLLRSEKGSVTTFSFILLILPTTLSYNCMRYGVEACVAERLTPLTVDLEVRGSSLAHRVVFLNKELCFTLSLFTQVYKWVPATHCWGGNPAMD